ncbi:autophagy-related protein 2 [Cryptotrichosporon argae]
MWPFPSLLALPFSLPALPTISLPTNIQRRFLSYVLKRALGRFVKTEGLDVEHIQAQLSQGSVEIDRLDVDAEGINVLIPLSLPLTLQCGSVSKIAARVPFPNLWSDPLSLSVDALHLEFVLAPHRPSHQAVPTDLDLASSFTSAADDFLHDELDAYEGAELDRSIRESLVFSSGTDVPGAFPNFAPASSSPGTLPAAESSTALAGLVERILARLECQVKDVRVRIRHAGANAGTFELRIGYVAYADESDGAAGHTRRVVSVKNVALFLQPPAMADSVATLPRPNPTRSASSSSSSSASSASSASTSYNEANDMFMSMAIADLRQSTMTPATGASVYASAIDIQEREPDNTPFEDLFGSRAATPTQAQSPGTIPSQNRASSPAEDPALLVSFSDDVVLQMTTTRPTPPVPLADSTERSPVRASTTVTTGVLPYLSVELGLGTITAVVLPAQAATVLSALQACSTTPSATAAPPDNSLPDAAQPRLDARVRLKALQVAVVYELDDPGEAITEAIKQYWTKPGSYLPIGHIRLRIDDVEGLYVMQGHVARAQPDSRRPKPPVASLTVADLSVFEYIHANAEISCAYPILIFDPGLNKQYDVPVGALAKYRPVDSPVFPDFESVDWRSTRKSEKGWRVKPKGKGILKGKEEQAGAAIVVRKPVSSDAGSIDTLPIHVFVDLSLVERLLPLLRDLAPATQREERRESYSVFPPTLPPALKRSPTDYIIDDLDADARAYGRPKEAELFHVRCPTVRVDIRCPAPLKARQGWGDGTHLRSGIVTLDVHGVEVKAKAKRKQHAGGIEVEWRKMMLFFCRVPDKRSSAFLIVGPLAPDLGDLVEGDCVLVPSIRVQTSTSPMSTLKTQVVTVGIPWVQANIRQHVVEGLQFFADDVTHWLDGAFGDGSAPRPRDDLKMIGSRFFASKASSIASSSEDEDDGDAATLLSISISEAEVNLHVPRNERPDRVFVLTSSDLSVKLESNTAGKQETAVTLVAADATFADRTNASAVRRILSRTAPPSFKRAAAPMLHLRFSSLTNQAGTKETSIRLSAADATAYVDAHLEWVAELAQFVKTPEGVFEDVVPAESTKIAVVLQDCSVHVATPNVGGALVWTGARVEARTTRRSWETEERVDMGVRGGVVLAIDDLKTSGALESWTDCVEVWKCAGYASLVEVDNTDIVLIRALEEKDILLDIAHVQVKLTACADSLATLGLLAGDLGALFPPPPDAPPVRPMTVEQSIDVFASIDNDAFTAAPDITSGADMMDDDLPTNLDYLDHAARQALRAPGSATSETLRSWEHADDDTGRREGGETVRVFDGPRWEMEEEYWENLPALWQGEEFRPGQVRVRVSDCDVTVLLHEGYDWPRTRKVIEDEIKAVRRRLEKIRQLLASGQKADASIEREGAPGSVLFNSVYIGLDDRHAFDDGDSEGGDDGPPGAELGIRAGLAGVAGMDECALLKAIDDELDDMETASTSSWGSFPEAATHAHAHVRREPSAASRTRLRGKRLTRSKRAQIEIRAAGISAEVDLYDDAPALALAQQQSQGDMASRMHVGVQSAEIIDHIKSSTWKMFLSEMRSDRRGNVRETGADMVGVELVGVRVAGEVEHRLRLKVLPLRLHVDQDALDFIKRFFSFSPPVLAGRPAEPKGKEPFFQRVEIFPVELKLDYKPKRVDYSALRQGRTIELMNFFHFDGAEMTLRHVTMSGITGWARLSTELQEIWTPDVKANQLADVISGVAPIRSLVNVGSGVADLILLPIEQYRKDGRLARGVQRGTSSFVKSTALEMMRLGARLATGTQVVLEKAEGVLGGRDRFGHELVGQVEAEPKHRAGGDGGDDDEDDEGARATSRFASQPHDVREGVTAAYESLSRNISGAAQTILAIPMEVYERSGDDGPLRAVVRAVPIAVLKPMIGASEAVSKTLLGMRNSLDPQIRRELEDKYKPA